MLSNSGWVVLSEVKMPDVRAVGGVNHEKQPRGIGNYRGVDPTQRAFGGGIELRGEKLPIRVSPLGEVIDKVWRNRDRSMERPKCAKVGSRG